MNAMALSVAGLAGVALGLFRYNVAAIVLAEVGIEDVA